MRRRANRSGPSGSLSVDVKGAVALPGVDRRPPVTATRRRGRGLEGAFERPDAGPLE
jgi:hypothetical protein